MKIELHFLIFSRGGDYACERLQDDLSYLSLTGLNVSGRLRGIKLSSRSGDHLPSQSELTLVKIMREAHVGMAKRWR